ncbi:MAG TPA: hypothetical protein VKC15_15155 [Gemmatimonadales bacterium]|nr:hypothetical protein [Gemmatimonadales bacterium]
MGRVAALAALVLGVGALACVHSTDATGYVFQYGITAFGCDTTCAAPDSTTPIQSAARGDTVWLQHLMILIAAVDSFTPQIATLRRDCAENVAVLAGNTTVRSLPTPTCADSTYEQAFQLAGYDYPHTIATYTRWVVDSQLAPTQYGLRGRLMVRPRIEPTLPFGVQ